MTGQRPTLSLCAWACNEESIVDEFVDKTLDDLARVSDDFELIVVDDGSTDSTLAKLQHLQKTCPQLRVVSHGRNLGYGECFRTTLAMATKDVVLWNTVDMFFDTRDLPNFLQHLNQFDLVGRLWFRWVVLRQVPRAAVRHRVTSLTARSWGKPGFLKGRRRQHFDLETEREFVNRIGPEYFSHKVLKPLSSGQMMDWPDTLLNAYDDMAAELRDYSAYLFAACYKPSRPA